MSDHVAAALRTALVRGKVTASIVGPRTILRVSGMDGQTADVELLLPPGMSARPAPGADITLHPVLGSHDHLVAMGGDSVGQVIDDLAEGEFGFIFNGYQVVFRTDHLEITGQNVTFRAATSGTDPVTIKLPLPVTPGPSGTLYIDGSHYVRQVP